MMWTALLGRQIRNVHERRIEVEPARVGELLDALAGDEDPLWPSPEWPPLVLDAPLGIGAQGGHGPVRYRVQEFVPGRRVVFGFHRSVGIDGTHALEVEADGGATVLRHVLRGRARAGMRIAWPLTVEPVHDALIEDLLDRAEARLVPGTHPNTPWSLRVRVLRRILGAAPHRIWVRRTVVRDAGLLRDVATHSQPADDGQPWDYADAYALRLPAGYPTDPLLWRQRVFGSSPPWLRQLMRVRDLAVAPFGLRTDADRPDLAALPVLANTATEVLMGEDDRHLDFRVVLRIEPADTQGARLVLTTVVRFHNLLGRLYFLPVGPVHRWLVPVMLRRAVARA